MNMSKYLFHISLIAILLISGCRKVEDRTQITIWHQMLYAERLVLADVLAEYERLHPEVKVTSLYRETEELRSGFQNSALAGSGPELVFGPSDQVGPFATMGIIRPLEGLLDSAYLVQFNPQGLTYFQDHLYQIADRLGNHLCLVYNKGLVPDPPQNTDDLIRIGQDLTQDFDGDGKMDQFGLVWNFTEPYFFVPFFGGFGGWVMDENHLPTLNTQAARDAFQFVIELRDEYKITPANCDYEMANTLFKDGMAGMIINGDWSWSTYQDAGIDIGITRIPQVVETGLWPTPMVSPKGYSINANIAEEKLEVTIELLKFLLTPDNQRKLTQGTNMMPTLASLRDDPVITGSEIMRNSLAQIEVGRPMPVVPELRAVWDAMRPYYQAVLGGSIGAEEAAKGMQEEAEKKIREMNTQLQPAPYAGSFKILILALFAVFLFWQRKTLIEFFRDLRNRPFVYWMVLPAFLIIVLTVLYPLIYNIILSASNMGLRNFFDWKIVGLQNYLSVFTEAVFYTVLGKTVIWTGVNIIFHVTIGVFLALLLHRVLPGKGVIRTLLILPWAVPQYITALTWRGMFNQEYGAINLVIAKYLHLPIVNWLGAPFEAFTACILTNIWLGFPFMMVVALGGLQSIPYSLYEAADIDGASWWYKIRRITLPLLKPVMTPAIVLGVVWTFNNLNVIWLVSNAGEPSDNTHILVSFVYKSAFNLYRYGYAAALSMVIFLILLMFGIFFLFRTKAEESVY
jgi:arabinogalactan oligomer/maltooligosaccharide transport system permease protein